MIVRTKPQGGGLSTYAGVCFRALLAVWICAVLLVPTSVTPDAQPLFGPISCFVKPNAVPAETVPLTKAHLISSCSSALDGWEEGSNVSAP